MNIQHLWTPVKREFWEYKTGMLWAPATVALLLVLFILYLTASYGFGNADSLSGFNGRNIIEFSGWEGDFSEKIGAYGLLPNATILEVFIHAFVGAVTFLLWLPLIIVLLIYTHGSLFDDRKNREILFWRSMPVSETQNVLTKFFVIGVAAPAIVLALTLVVVIVMLLAYMTVFFSVTEEELDALPILFTLWLPIKMYGATLCYFVILLPAIAWMIFCSAAATKSPVMLSSLVPILLIVIDKIANKFLAIDLHVMAAFDGYWKLLQAVEPSQDIFLTVDLIQSFVISMIVAGLLIFITIWLRNNRYEI